MAATIQDVAELVGCSITTVSRAYSTPEKVRACTLQKIHEVAHNLHYSPNAIARAMVLQQNHSLAFIIGEKHYPVLLNPFYAEIAQAVQLEAEANGYTVCITSDHDTTQASSLFINKRVDGAIFAGEANAWLVEHLREQNVPMVFVNNESARDVSIISDDYNGTVQALTHLMERGHTKIGLLAGKLFHYVSDTRYQAYIDTMTQHGLPIYAGHICAAEPTQADALRVVDALLHSENPPTALFCMNDALAIGAIKAALRMGVRIPQELALVGFDDSTLCSVIEPELTSVNVDTGAMGRLCTHALLGMVNGDMPKEMKIVLQTKLTVRQTT